MAIKEVAKVLLKCSQLFPKEGQAQSLALALVFLGFPWVLAFPPLVFPLLPREHALSYLSLRACIGLWTAFFCVVLVATDASSLVCYITRFTEEAFASLICIIFIYEALEKLSHLRETYPVHMHSKLDLLTIY